MNLKINTKSLVILAIYIISGASYASSLEAPLFISGATKINAEEVIEVVNKHPKLVIIDSRITGDRKKGYIESSISLPNTKTDCQSLSKVLPKKDAVAIFYCNGVKCGRSVDAIKIALKCGYKNLYWFRGGFEEWLQKDLPYINGWKE